MPVYIKELVVRARVENQSKPDKPSPEHPGASQVDRKALVEDCVDEVLQILERKQER